MSAKTKVSFLYQIKREDRIVSQTKTGELVYYTHGKSFGIRLVAEDGSEEAKKAAIDKFIGVMNRCASAGMLEAEAQMIEMMNERLDGKDDSKGHIVFMQGSAGLGKSFLAEKMSKATGQEYRIFVHDGGNVVSWNDLIVRTGINTGNNGPDLIEMVNTALQGRGSLSPNCIVPLRDGVD